MAAVNNSEFVKDQYKTADNLNIRISIHDKYSVNKQGFGNWIVSNYSIANGARVLELGCGTGAIWNANRHLIDRTSELVLTDISKGMLDSAENLIGKSENISYKTVDIQDIPFEDSHFDIIIANMMLYHVPDINKGLSEVRRVLKKDGGFYCATYGEHGIMDYISYLLGKYGVKDETNKSFTLQNGTDILSAYFDTVERLDYEDALNVTDLDDMVDYILSFSAIGNIISVDKTVIKHILENNTVNGVLYVPKEYGMFVCKAPLGKQI